MPPKVSVTMPVYNAEPFLREAIESILNQTFQDFELIMVDDCSTDKSWQIMNEYAAKDPRIVVFQNEQNLRSARTRNRALSAVRGEYIAVLDSDDVALPQRLERQVKFLDENPNVGAVAAGVCLIDDKGRFVQTNSYSRYDNPVSIEAGLSINSIIVHSATMMRRQVIEQVGGYASDLPCAEDYDLWSRLVAVTPIGGLPDILVLYRFYQATNRISVARRNVQKEVGGAISLRLMKRLMGEHPLDEAAYQRFWSAGIGLYPTYKIDRGDLLALSSLWAFLAKHPALRYEWGLSIWLLALRLIRRRRFKHVAPLLWIAFGKLKMYTPASMWKFFKFVIGSRIKPKSVSFPG